MQGRITSVITTSCHAGDTLSVTLDRSKLVNTVTGEPGSGMTTYAFAVVEPGSINNLVMSGNSVSWGPLFRVPSLPSTITLSASEPLAPGSVNLYSIVLTATGCSVAPQISSAEISGDSQIVVHTTAGTCDSSWSFDLSINGDVAYGTSGAPIRGTFNYHVDVFGGALPNPTGPYEYASDPGTLVTSAPGGSVSTQLIWNYSWPVAVDSGFITLGGCAAGVASSSEDLGQDEGMEPFTHPYRISSDVTAPGCHAGDTLTISYNAAKVHNALSGTAGTGTVVFTLTIVDPAP
jgi:hypothetical protein